MALTILPWVEILIQKGVIEEKDHTATLSLPSPPVSAAAAAAGACAGPCCTPASLTLLPVPAAHVLPGARGSVP